MLFLLVVKIPGLSVRMLRPRQPKHIAKSASLHIDYLLILLSSRVCRVEEVRGALAHRRRTPSKVVFLYLRLNVAGTALLLLADDIPDAIILMIESRFVGH